MRRVSGFLALLIGCMLLAACGTTSSTSSGSGDWFYHWNCNGDPECLATQPGAANQESGTIDEGPVEAECTQILQFGQQFWSAPATQSCDQNANGGGGGTTGAPTVSGVSPTGAIPGTSITITGSNFPTTTTGVTVTIDGVTCTVTSASSTQIVCTIGGMGDFTGPIVVTTSGGSVDSGTFTVANPLYGVGLAQASTGGFWAVGANGTLMSSGDGVNWTLHSVGVTGFLASVTSSAIQTVTVGEAGSILRSPTGQTFFTASTGTNDLFGLTWNGSVFVALGAGGTILHSPDGATWTSASSPTAQDLISSAWSGSQFVACGHNAAVLTSPDGSSWTLRSATAAGGENLLGSAFGNGTFVLVGNAGVIVYSTNGTTWTATTSHTSDALFGVVWSGTKFVAVGDQGTILTSPDGINWTAVSSSAANGNVLNSVTYTNSKYVAVGGNGTIIVSSDGATWTHEAGI
jgi:photosystem II stability/assembly factor-like uncharacterized protein